MTDTERSTAQSLSTVTDGRGSGRLVVGVDGSHGSTNALLWAFGEARARGIPIHAVLAWQYHAPWVDPGLGSMFPMGHQLEDDLPPDEFARFAAAVDRQLHQAIRGAEQADPDNETNPVPISRAALEGHAARVLLECVGEKDIMVVGSHGHGGFLGTTLGSISQHVVSHASCPVVVVPDPRRSGEA